MSIKNMAVLTRLGLFDPKKIKEPTLETRAIWEEIKANYV